MTPAHRPRSATAAAPGAALRAEAARSLVRVVFDGASLRAVLAQAQPRIADPRDRALFAATLYATSRWWLRHDAALARLLDKPLPAGAREVRALLVLGFVQLAVLGLPAYAVTGSAVEAVRLLGKPGHAGLVNALLRRFVRERATLDAALDADEVTRHAHPRWLVDAIRADWPAQADAILEAGNREAPLTLRVNRRRASREELLASLRAQDVDAAAHPLAVDAVVLAQGHDVTRLDGYAEGCFSVQDAAAQRVVDLLAAEPGQRVLDACAAPGGKAAHMLERTDVELLALDADAERIARMRGNFERLGLVADLRTGDATRPHDWWDGRPFARILLDAPCSASGIVRRQPDIKLHRRAADIEPLVQAQAAMLTALWPLLAPGGRLVYATCSLLRAENEAVVAGFLAAHDDASARPLPAEFGHAAGAGRQNLPGEGGMDGFFHAVFDKRH